MAKVITILFTITRATCMFYTGIDPFTKQKVYVTQHLRDRKLQRALMQYFKRRITLKSAKR